MLNAEIPLALSPTPDEFFQAAELVAEHPLLVMRHIAARSYAFPALTGPTKSKGSRRADSALLAPVAARLGVSVPHLVTAALEIVLGVPAYDVADPTPTPSRLGAAVPQALHQAATLAPGPAMRLLVSSPEESINTAAAKALDTPPLEGPLTSLTLRPSTHPLSDLLELSARTRLPLSVLVRYALILTI